MSIATRAGGSGDLMNRIYRRQRFFYDLTRRPYLLGRDYLIGELDLPRGGTILEIGCGTGRNLIKAASRFPDARLFGLDISSEMLATARASIRRAGLSGRIVLAEADAASFCAGDGFGLASVDRAFFSYTLSMIPAWREALDNALQATAEPGGQVHLVDFGQQQGLPSWFRIGLYAWLRQFHVTPRAGLAAAVLDLAEAAQGRASARDLYRGYAIYAAVRR